LSCCFPSVETLGYWRDAPLGLILVDLLSAVPARFTLVRKPGAEILSCCFPSVETLGYWRDTPLGLILVDLLSLRPAWITPGVENLGRG